MKMLAFVATPLARLSLATSLLAIPSVVGLAACGGKQPMPQDVGVPTSDTDASPASSQPASSAAPSAAPTSAPLPQPTGDQGAPPPPPPVDTASPGT